MECDTIGDGCLFQAPPMTGGNLNYFYPHIWEISRVVHKKTLSGVCCMKPMRIFILSACWSRKIASSFAGAGHGRIAWQRFLANNFADFPDMRENNQDFIPLLVAFGIINICYCPVHQWIHLDQKEELNLWTVHWQGGLLFKVLFKNLFWSLLTTIKPEVECW